MAESKKKKKSKSKSLEAISSLNLHKKYRPQVIEDYYGQDAVQKTVSGWIKTRKYPSTILITGMTGSGKTTMARLLHLYINCDIGTACGKCSSCQMSPKAHPDYKEVNAGEEGLVSDIRNLIKQSDYSPMMGNKRIIVVDEIHLLSKAAASALLVPIEEPYENTIWIFCTTDTEKILTTVKNRCTQLTINPIPPEKIYDRLNQIVKLEKIKFKDKEKKNVKKALQRISEFSEGQMRSGISQLQTMLGAVANGEKFTAETAMQVYSQNGDVQYDETAADLLVAMMDHDAISTIKIIQSCGEIRSLLSKMLWLLDWLLQYNCDVVKWQPYIGKTFLSKAKAHKAKLDKKEAKDFEKAYSIPNLINIQDVCIQVQITLNTVSIPEKVLMSNWCTKAVVSDYNYTVKR